VNIEKCRIRNTMDEGWYLKHIEVQAPGCGETMLFPCNAWLGQSDCGSYDGEEEREGELHPFVYDNCAWQCSRVGGYNGEEGSRGRVTCRRWYVSGRSKVYNVGSRSSPCNPPPSLGK
jgi:hypothetical protein